MQKMPDAFRQHLGQTLLGRLKLKLFEQITGDEEHLPNPQHVRHYIVAQHRSNAEVGMFLLKLLSPCRSCTTFFSELQRPKYLERMLKELEETPLAEPFFLEITDCPDELPKTLGTFVYRESLADGGYVYVTTLMDESGFPDDVVGWLEVRANRVAPEPAFCVFEQDGWVPYSLTSYQDSPLALLVTKILNYICLHRHRRLIPLSELPRSKIEDRPGTCPPLDQRYQTMLRLVIHGLVECSEAEVALSQVRPHSIDFCFTFPLDVVDEASKNIQRSLINRLLVYWHKDAFVMSDDYAYYLAYRRLGFEEVPVVIMGPYPEAVVTPTKVGGRDMIPPAGVSFRNTYKSYAPELRDFFLDVRLQRKPVSEAVLRLYGFFLVLSGLIQNTGTKEKQLHDFLLENPIALAPFGVHVEAELRLGKDYRVDLAVQYDLTDKRILLIELERANLPIFTKKGRPRAMVTHATQQVEDWLRWWRENPTRVPRPFDSSLPVEGLVVIGRSIDLDEDAKRRLLHLNHNRQVKVTTYDDLLDRVESLIVNLENQETTAS